MRPRAGPRTFPAGHERQGGPGAAPGRIEALSPPRAHGPASCPVRSLPTPSVLLFVVWLCGAALCVPECEAELTTRRSVTGFGIPGLLYHCVSPALWLSKVGIMERRSSSVRPHHSLRTVRVTRKTAGRLILWALENLEESEKNARILPELITTELKIVRCGGTPGWLSG